MWHFIIQCSQLLSHISHINRIGDASHPGKSWAPKDITATAIISKKWTHQRVEDKNMIYDVFNNNLWQSITCNEISKKVHDCFHVLFIAEFLSLYYLARLLYLLDLFMKLAKSSSHVFVINKKYTWRDLDWQVPKFKGSHYDWIIHHVFRTWPKLHQLRVIF